MRQKILTVLLIIAAALNLNALAQEDTADIGAVTQSDKEVGSKPVIVFPPVSDTCWLTYTIKMPQEDGSFAILGLGQETVKKGECFKLPEVNDTKRYKFMGWWSNEENPVEYTSETPITHNVYLNCKWEERTYNVTFFKENKEYKNVTAKYGEKVSLPDDPIKKGYIFKGWFTEKYGKGDKVTEDITVQDDIKLYGAYTKDYLSGSKRRRSSSVVINANTKPEQSGEEIKVPDTDDKGNANGFKKRKRKKFILGYPDGTFRPDNNISNAEAAAMLARISEDFDASKVSEESKSSWWDEWYADAAAYICGLTDKEPTGLDPDKEISRLDFCVWLCKVLDIKPSGADSKIDDIKNTEGAEYINALFETGILTGYGDGKFKPYEAITRAEAVTLINRTFADDGQTVLPGAAKYSDVPNDYWAYKDIVKADE